MTKHLPTFSFVSPFAWRSLFRGPDRGDVAVIVRASVSGEGTEGGILEDLAVSCLFFVLGQLVLFSAAYATPV